MQQGKFVPVIQESSQSFSILRAILFVAQKACLTSCRHRICSDSLRKRPTRTVTRQKFKQWTSKTIGFKKHKPSSGLESDSERHAS